MPGITQETRQLYRNIRLILRNFYQTQDHLKTIQILYHLKIQIFSIKYTSKILTLHSYLQFWSLYSLTISFKIC
jgi:hypothetical protein